MMGLLLTIYLFLQLLYLLNDDLLSEIMRIEELTPAKLQNLEMNLALIALLIGIVSVMNVTSVCAKNLTNLVLCI